MEILTGEQMRRVDRRAIDELGIPGLQLMEAAGLGVADALLEDYPDAASSGVVILCGKGNNGGDGLVAARYLARRGVDPCVLLLTGGGELSAEVSHNLDAAREACIEIREVADSAAWQRARTAVAPPHIVLDAMLGTGVRGGARGLVAEAIEQLHRAGCRTVAVDLPSGIDADSGCVEGPVVTAERTYTLCRPKIALLLDPAAGHCGAWRVVPIGIPDRAVKAESPMLEWIDAGAASGLLPSREPDSHKGSYGHLLAVAGSRGKSGAAVLLARAALRCGVGLITVATAASNQERIAVQQAEVMTEPLPEKAGGSLAVEAAGAVLELAAERQALAIGPGLGSAPSTRDAVRAVVAGCECPAVIDADGLNALAASAASGLLPRASGPELVLTPHPGEAARLLHGSTADVQSDRLGSARRLAETTGATVVLKGRHTLVAGPGGRVAFNSTGNPGMATGGTGDVLSGAVGAFLARGMSAWDAARLAVFAHGDAGDRAAREVGRDGMIASDVVQRLPRALSELARGAP